MSRRIDYHRASPQGIAGLRQLEAYLETSSLESSLLHLVKTRASQLNGCAYCLDMHTKDARAGGESEQRLHTLCAWRETSFFSERERAALALTERMTLIAQRQEDEAMHVELGRHFSEKEIVDLGLAIVAINAWNRLAVTFGADVGSYQPRAKRGP